MQTFCDSFASRVRNASHLTEQGGATEDKYLQYVYRTLGTPKAMKYDDFDSHPLANAFARHIKVALAAVNSSDCDF